MPRSRVRESVGDIEDELLAKIADAAEVRAQARETAVKVKDTAKSMSPVDEGTYAAAWRVDKKLRKTRDGLPAHRVVNDDWKAHWIEYGTGTDTKEESPFGKDTPTPEFAVARRAAAMFGGTIGPSDKVRE